MDLIEDGNHVTANLCKRFRHIVIQLVYNRSIIGVVRKDNNVEHMCTSSRSRAARNISISYLPVSVFGHGILRLMVWTSGVDALIAY